MSRRRRRRDRVSTSLRLMPKLSQDPTKYCGWFDDGPRGGTCPARLSRRRSSAQPPRRDRCRAPAAPPRLASAATAAINFAVAGIEPVEPAATTGCHDARSGARLPRSIRRSRRPAGSIRPISFRCSGHALARDAKIPASAANICRAGPTCSCSQLTPRVNHVVDLAAVVAWMRDHRPPAAPTLWPLTTCASVRAAFSSPSLGGISSGATPPNCRSLPKMPAHSRSYRRAQRCAAGSRHPSSIPREKFPRQPSGALVGR